MNLEVKIVAPELAAALNNLAAAIAGRAITVDLEMEAPAEPGKPKTRARAAAKPEPTGSDTPPSSEGSGETASDTAGTSDTASDPESDGPASDAPIDYERIKKAVVNLSLSKGRDAVVAILTEFDVTKADQVPAEKRGELLARLEGALA